MQTIDGCRVYPATDLVGFVEGRHSRTSNALPSKDTSRSPRARTGAHQHTSKQLKPHHREMSSSACRYPSEDKMFCCVRSATAAAAHPHLAADAGASPCARRAARTPAKTSPLPTADLAETWNAGT